MKLSLTVLVNDEARPPFQSEHGLSLSLKVGHKTILLDTGAGKTLLPNMKLMAIEPESFDLLVFSHGHYDHTGGLAKFLALNHRAIVYHGVGLEKERYSAPAGEAPHSIAMPSTCRKAFLALSSCRAIPVHSLLKIDENLLLTGPIQRRSREDCGGSFFLDPKNKTCDSIADEISFIVSRAEGNILISGCCHAGLLNTLNCCEDAGYPIETVVGGLHLKNASSERLHQTVEFLNRSQVRHLYLLHCTGENAFEFFQKQFCGSFERLQAGDIREI